MNNVYRVFGLHVSSAIPLPAMAIPHVKNNTPIDVVIEYGDTPATLINPKAQGVRYQAAPGKFLLRVDGIARYVVKNGNHIVITPEASAFEDDILVFLMGSVFGALLHQRNVLALHAGAIEAKGKGIIFAGLSGTGKSTLAAGFHKRGYPVLADDVCAVNLYDGHPAVIPGFPRLKLWGDVLEKMKRDTNVLQSVRWGGELKKYYLPIENISDTHVPIKSVFILTTTNSDKIEITALQASEKIDPLIHHTYRKHFLGGLGGKKEHFAQCATMAAKASVYRTIRPKKGFLLDQLMDMVEERFLP